MSLVRPVEATEEEVFAESCGADLGASETRGAEFDVVERCLLLEGNGGGATVDEAEGVRVHEFVRPAEELDRVLTWRPCNSRSALQARWNNLVMEL